MEKNNETQKYNVGFALPSLLAQLAFYLVDDYTNDVGPDFEALKRLPEIIMKFRKNVINDFKRYDYREKNSYCYTIEFESYQELRDWIEKNINKIDGFEHGDVLGLATDIARTICGTQWLVWDAGELRKQYMSEFKKYGFDGWPDVI